LEAITYQVVHAIAGRIRIRIPLLEMDSEFAAKLQSILATLQFVTSVRINTFAQSLILNYNAQVISDSDFQIGFAKAIEQLNAERGFGSDAVAPQPGSTPSGIGG